jgi:hypothetical protein
MPIISNLVVFFIVSKYPFAVTIQRINDYRLLGNHTIIKRKYEMVEILKVVKRISWRKIEKWSKIYVVKEKEWSMI